MGLDACVSLDWKIGFCTACHSAWGDMLREFENLLSDKLQISADKDTLKEQVTDFEPLYQEIMGKEHEELIRRHEGMPVSERCLSHAELIWR